MPDKPEQREVFFLWSIMNDHAILASSLSLLFYDKPSPRYIRTILSGNNGISQPRKKTIEDFLRYIKIPEHEIERAWSKIFVDEYRKKPATERIASVNKQVAEFKAQYRPDSEKPEPKPFSLLDVEVPVLQKQILSVAACKAFDFLDRQGNAVDPFFQDYKDPETYKGYEYPGYTIAFEEILRAAKLRAMIALVAPPASGKSYLWARVRLSLVKKGYLICEPRLLTKGRISEGTLLNAILAEIAEDPGFKPKHSIEGRCEQIFELLTIKNKGMKKIALVIDEAQELTPTALKVLKRLHDWCYGPFDNLLSIILIGHLLLKSNLLDNFAVEETGRRTIIHELAPLDSIEKFISWRLSTALGRSIEIGKLYTPAGLKGFENLLDQSNHSRRWWKPLHICNLASLVFERAYTLAEPQITEQIIGDIYNQAAERRVSS